MRFLLSLMNFIKIGNIWSSLKFSQLNQYLINLLTMMKILHAKQDHNVIYF